MSNSTTDGDVRDKPLDNEADPTADAEDESNCSICLCQMDDKSFTDSCFHSFCFTCLFEWSKVKAECPLCKKRFDTIIHNIRSEIDYDVFDIQLLADLCCTPRRTTEIFHADEVSNNF